MSRGVDVAIPTAVITGRDEVRSVCDANCDLIVAAEDVPGLEAHMKAPAQILEDAEDPNSGLMPNPEPHLEPYPMMDPQEFLTRRTAPKPATTSGRASASRRAFAQTKLLSHFGLIKNQPSNGIRGSWNEYNEDATALPGGTCIPRKGVVVKN